MLQIEAVSNLHPEQTNLKHPKAHIKLSSAWKNVPAFV